MSTKYNFTQAKNKFKNDENIISYFILVESYEKHLDSGQESGFLNPDSIDDMINLLDDKQLNHLKSLVRVFYISKYDPQYRLGNRRHLDSLSEWFKDNIYNSPRFSEKTIINKCREIGKKLFDKIKNVEKERLEAKKGKEELFNQYKSRLSDFGGNSVEYREWLALLVKDHGIPDIDRIHDVTKLLRRLDIEYLKKFENSFDHPYYTDNIIKGIEHLEPYLYNLATYDMKTSDRSYLVQLNKSNPEYKAFQLALKDLNSKIESILEEKGAYTDLVFQIKKILLSRGTDKELIAKIKELVKERDSENKKLTEQLNAIIKKVGENGDQDLVDDISRLIKEGGANIYEKIDNLKTSYIFYEDIKEILSAIGNNEKYLKDAIAEYSKPMAHGDAFNDYLRKATFLEKLANAKVSVSDITSFRNKILKVRKYFLDHLAHKKYTVYRGMKFDGLLALLDTADPKLSELEGNQDSLIEEINKKQPIVFDEGFVSTSLNEGISATEFKGKERGNVFFTIEIPAGSKALVLDYEGILNVPREEEILLAERTKIKINFIEAVNGHLEIDATVAD